jgi:hypothetical protein
MHFAVNRHTIWPLAAVALMSGGSVRAAQCYDLSKGERNLRAA